MKSTQTVQVHILNAFTDHDAGGNPAGVVLNADDLTNSQKLLIAQKAGLSETAFVSKSNMADFKLDFFTPVRQIAHCGHATIAVFSYLTQQGIIQSPHTSKETIDGRREIFIEGDQAFMEQKAPFYKPVDAYHSKILAALHITENDLLPGAPVLVTNTGNSFAVIPVSGTEQLKNIVPDFNLMEEISEQLDLIGFYVFCLNNPAHSLRDATTRMFAPRYGIKEEAGTGMAAGPLACYLFDVLNLNKQEVLIEQGWFMNPPSPSLIKVNLTVENGRIIKLMAGGKGILQKTITVEL